MIESALACAGVALCFDAARRLSGRLGHPPWASPVLVTAIVVVAVLALAGVPLARFEAAALPLRWMLGPALVALALVIDGNRQFLRSDAIAVLAAVGGGTLVGIGSALGLAWLFGLGELLTRALATKTITAPFVVAILRTQDGPVALAAALSVLTGVIGALTVPSLLDRLRIGDGAARGLAIGVSSHIVGTDWLTRRDPRGGGLAALAFVLAGLVAAVVVPLLWPRLPG